MKGNKVSLVARQRDEARSDQPVWNHTNSALRNSFQAWIDDLEFIANWKADLERQLRESWSLTSDEYDRLKLGVAAFAAFCRLEGRAA
jgi:hypothetical protein